MKHPYLTPALQRLKPGIFKDPVSFHAAPPSGEALRYLGSPAGQAQQAALVNGPLTPLVRPPLSALHRTV